MRHPKQLIISRRHLNGVFAAVLAVSAGCQGAISSPPVSGTGNGPGTAGNSGTGNGMGSGGAGVGVGGGAGGVGGPGTGGAIVGKCMGASDPRLVVAPQRLLRLTQVEIVNSLRTLVDAAEATAVAAKYGIGDETERTFPPLNSPREGLSIIPTQWEGLDGIASTVGQYVFDNFARLTACPATATDACAQAYINGLAEKAFRRPLTTAETMRLGTLYSSIKSSTVAGVAVTSTIQEATQGVVYAILSAPQFLYRSEFGNKAAPSSSPPGVPLTQYELASQISFALAGTPPDQMLLDAAKAGSLSTTLATHVSRLLGTQTVKDNLTAAMASYYKLNLLPRVIIDPAKYPSFNTQLRNDMGTEGTSFLNYALWTGNLTDLVTSKVVFLNSNPALATLYGATVPAGATPTNFVPTTLTGTAASRRSGIVTNLGFITSRARPDVGSVVTRGLVIKDAMLCVTTPGPPATLEAAVAAAKAMIPNQTAKEQIAYRASVPICAGCHANFDAYGLVLENYDAIGGWRTTDEMGRPVDTSTKLPEALGSATVADAIDFAQTLSTSPGFVSCIAKSVMQYALADVTSAPVDVAGCAVADVADKYNAGTPKTFAEMVRDVMTSKTVALRAAQ